MPASPAYTDISLNINISVKTGDSASCSCCFPLISEEKQAGNKEVQWAGKQEHAETPRCEIDTHISPIIQETCLKTGKQREIAEFRSTGACAQFSHPAGTHCHLPGSKPSIAQAAELLRHMAVRHASRKMESFPESSISFNFLLSIFIFAMSILQQTETNLPNFTLGLNSISSRLKTQAEV